MIKQDNIVRSANNEKQGPADTALAMLSFVQIELPGGGAAVETRCVLSMIEFLGLFSLPRMNFGTRMVDGSPCKMLASPSLANSRTSRSLLLLT
jgi:hypothetical protein